MGRKLVVNAAYNTIENTLLLLIVIIAINVYYD